MAKFFAAGSCVKGDKCTYIHDGVVDAPNAAFAGSSKAKKTNSFGEFDAQFKSWRSQILTAGQKKPLPLTALLRFCQKAREFVEKGVEMSQQVVVLLASDGGILRFRTVMDLCKQKVQETQKQQLLTEGVLPLFEVLVHEKVERSAVLEEPLGTIFNCLYGPFGQRVVSVYTSLLESDELGSNVLSESLLGTVLAVLSKAIDVNSHALVNEDLCTISTRLEALLLLKPSATGQKKLDRIQRRLNVIKPDASSNIESVTGALATFNLARDGPGKLAPDGPRHDNDHADFTKIRCMPTAQEVEATRVDYLPSIYRSDWHIQGIKGLLDRNFRLLREDKIGPLREVVHAELQRFNGQGYTKDATQLMKTFTYRQVEIMDVKLFKHFGLCFDVEFALPEHLKNLPKSAQADWWAQSKRLRVNALVCLLSAEGDVYFCEVVALVLPAAANTPESNSIPILEESETYTGLLTLKLVENTQSDLQELSKRACKKRDNTESKLFLVEFPGALIASFNPTLKALQDIARRDEMPFESLVLQDSTATPNIKPPLYATRQGFSFNLKSANRKDTPGVSSFTPGQPFDFEAFKSSTVLDEAQATSLVDALSRELALLQGPPGTGKSFVGCALIKILLQARKSASLGPILCVTYTNHALDQLLEHLLDAEVEQIVRMGGQSKSERLKAINLYDLSFREVQTKAEGSIRWTLKTKANGCVESLNEDLQNLRQCDTRTGFREYLMINHNKVFEQLFPSSTNDKDEDGFMVVGARNQSPAIHRWLFSPGAHQIKTTRPVQELLDADVWTMSLIERIALRDFLHDKMYNEALESLSHSIEEMRCVESQQAKLRREAQLRVLDKANVVGCTTTGLAKNIELLRHMPIKILVCEEAGEVLEAHLLTALLPSIEHAILIGDHEQLRPQIANYELQHDNPRGQQYSFDMSLFERLVKPHDNTGIPLPFGTLQTQRRMHPSISKLIRSTLYPQLEDFESVAKYPPVSGLSKRLFWFNHNFPEDGETGTFSFSKSNTFEIDMTAALVSHLIRQGTYGNGDIAVLSPYLGQLTQLRRKLSRTYEIVVNDRDQQDIDLLGLDELATLPVVKASMLKTVRVATVDNFQGEEAKIVIISLVRSNAQHKCGFLRTSNRINVLLSRAMHGMYLIGNADTYASIPMWATVLDLLKADDNYGDLLQLRCPRHPDSPMEVASPEDFSRFSPEGGCDHKCEKRLACGHACLNKCHADPLHASVKCLEPCPRPRKDCDHPCLRLCGEPCETQCSVPLKQLVMLDCGHDRDEVTCWESQNMSLIRCTIPVKCSIKRCGHEVMLPCFRSFESEITCPAICGSALPCGHDCKRFCSQCRVKAPADLVNEEEVVEHGPCQQFCGRAFTTCSHSCQKACHNSKPCPPCNAKCDTFCGHSTCSKICSEPCVPCAEDKCKSACPHSQCTMPCAAPCDWVPCSNRCTLELSCGHQCPSICGEACPSSEFCQICADENIRSTVVDLILFTPYQEVDLDENPIIVPRCGHLLTMSSMDGHLEVDNCYILDDDRQPTAIKTSSQPFSSGEMKRCSTCRGSLRSIARYGRIIRRALLDESTRKFVVSNVREFIPLAERFYNCSDELSRSSAPFKPAQHRKLLKQTSIVVHGPISEQLATINSLTANRYQKLVILIRLIYDHLATVQRDAQPYQQVWNLVQAARNRRVTEGSFDFDDQVLQARGTLQATVLLVRSCLLLFTDFKKLCNSDSVRIPVRFDMQAIKAMCQHVATEAETSFHIKQQVEALVCLVRCFVIEMRQTDRCAESQAIAAEANSAVESATQLCAAYSGQTASLMVELEEVTRVLNGGVFYQTVTDDERRSVLNAMRTEFIGTGHFYTCVNGHLFTIGNCGMPVQLARCNECGAQVGGSNYQVADGVTHAHDFERGQFV